MGLSTPENSLITIFCMTFNHVNSIRASLDGFLSQKCSYPFCIIVHDDCSTDGTADVVREYAEKYPGMIVPILQEKNQYTQGVDIERTFIMPMIKTKYTVECEGDDYWCDENKLQIQADWMEAHDECALCVHNTERIDGDGNHLGTYLNDAGRDYDIPVDTLIRDLGDNLFQTSSMFHRSEYFLERPADFSMGLILDYPTALYMALNGTVHYIDKVMSCYRSQNPGSWTVQVMGNLERKKAHTREAIDFLNYLDSFTGGKYHDAVEHRISNYRYSLNLETGNISEIMKNSVHRKKYLKTVVLYKIKRAVKNVIMPDPSGRK